MITLTRKQLRQLRAMFRKALSLSGRSPGPAVTFQATPDTLCVRAAGEQTAVEFRQAGQFAVTSFAAPFQLLTACEGGKAEPVQLHCEGENIRVQWSDAGIPQVATFEKLEPSEFPQLPASMQEHGQSLLTALADAVTTAEESSTRYALHCLRLRGGNQGQIAATDGRQILIQDGFEFPWEGDVLVPACRALTGLDLRPDMQVEIGRSEHRVAIRTGPWAFWLKINEEGRFPVVEDHVRELSEATSVLHLSDDDATFLAQAVGRLPASGEFNAPVTVDLNGTVSVRAKSADQPAPTELVLTGSRREGEAVRFSTNREYLARAARMGFRSAHVFGPEVPVCCRDQHRTYVWALLEKQGVIPADPTATRIESPRASAKKRKRRRGNPNNMPKKSTDNHETRRTSHADANESLDVITQAEALRDTLGLARSQTRELIAALKRQRRQTKSLQSAISSIQQLRVADAA